jgi:putative transposase
MCITGVIAKSGTASGRDARRAAVRYEKLVEQGKGVRLWDDALRQQIYLGDDSFIQRMQALLGPERIRAAEVPRPQRRTRPDSTQAYMKAYERNEAKVRACREGGHTLSAIAREVGLSVSRVSRIIAAYEQGLAMAKGKT